MENLYVNDNFDILLDDKKWKNYEMINLNSFFNKNNVIYDNEDEDEIYNNEEYENPDIYQYQDDEPSEPVDATDEAEPVDATDESDETEQIEPIDESDESDETELTDEIDETDETELTDETDETDEDKELQNYLSKTLGEDLSSFHCYRKIVLIVLFMFVFLNISVPLFVFYMFCIFKN